MSKIAPQDTQEAPRPLAAALVAEGRRRAISNGIPEETREREAAQAAIVSVISTFSEASGHPMIVDDMIQVMAVASATFAAQSETHPFEFMQVFTSQFLPIYSAVHAMFTPSSETQQ